MAAPIPDEMSLIWLGRK